VNALSLPGFRHFPFVLTILFYYFTFTLIHLVTVSVVSFFHFLMDHSLSIVEDWVFRYSWELIIFSKVVSFLIIHHVMRINQVMFSLRKSIKMENYQGTFHVFVGIIFLYFILIWLGKPIVSMAIFQNMDQQLIAFVGTFLFYALDILIYVALTKTNESKFDFFLLLFQAFVAFGVFYIVVPMVSSESLWVFIHMFSGLLIYQASKSLVATACYLFFLTAPIAAFLGLDPIWKNNYSMISLVKNLSWGSSISIWSIFIIYFLLSLRRKAKFDQDSSPS